MLLVWGVEVPVQEESRVHWAGTGFVMGGIAGYLVLCRQEWHVGEFCCIYGGRGVGTHEVELV